MSGKHNPKQVNTVLFVDDDSVTIEAISVNGIRVGGLNRRTYFAHEANPGKVTEAAENWLYEVQTRTIKVETGERYYIRAILGFGIQGTDNPRIEMVPKFEGETTIKKLKYATLYKNVIGRGRFDNNRFYLT